MTITRTRLARAALRRKRFLTTGALYLVPRFMPLALVVILTIKSGVDGLGDVALALSLWQFFLVVSDFGVSQWLLTKNSLTGGEIKTSLGGRTLVGAACALVVAVLATLGWLPMSPEAAVGLVICLALSFGQMAFAWQLQRGAPRRAAAFVGIEFVIPVAAIFVFSDPLYALLAVMIAKTAFSLFLTGASVASARVETEPEGLSPRAFGVHSSAWALTSVASGTGELMLVGSIGNAALVGVYRIFQTIASLGSTVGFAALAPLMSRRGQSTPSLWKPMLILGLVAAAFVALGMVPGIGLAAHAFDDQTLWVVLVASSLSVSAILSTMAIAPLSEVARLHGTRYSLIIGLATCAVYWSTIFLLYIFKLPLGAPLAPLLAASVGFLGNMFVHFRLTRRRTPDHNGADSRQETRDAI